eukprot:gene1632-1780_t
MTKTITSSPPGVSSSLSSLSFCLYLASSSTTSSSSPVTPSSSSSTPFATKAKRQHKNKYDQFSHKKTDPYYDAIAKVEKVQEEAYLATVTRGTTIPTALGSNNVRLSSPTAQSKNKSFNLTHHSDSDIDSPGDSHNNIADSDSNIDSERNNSDSPSETNMLTSNRTTSQNQRVFHPSKIIPDDPSTYGYHEVGRILGAHGVKGEIKIDFYGSDFAEQRIQANSILFLKKPIRRSPRPVKVISGRKQQDSVYLVQLEHINSRLTASVLKGYQVYVQEHDRPHLKEDEYLIRDIVGCVCYVRKCKKDEGEVVMDIKQEDDLEPCGKVVGVVPPEELCESPSMASVMHSLLEVRLIGSADRCLLPFVPAIVLHVDIEAKKIIIEPPSGLLEQVYRVEEKVVVKGLLPARINWLTSQERAALEANSLLLFSEGGTAIPLW